MPGLRLLPTLIRESVLSTHQDRIPEPMVMDDQGQVDAFAEAGRIDGTMAASYLFQSARISQAIQGCKQVIDLGCGPATQLAQVAALNPEIQFIGLDLSEEMLDSARLYLDDLGIHNVDLRIGDITDLKGFQDQSIDGLISTMAFHQLPELPMLRDTFSEAARVLKPDGAVYFTDFGRLKSPKSCHFFAHLNAAHQPPVFTEDYLASLHAAFLLQDYVELCEEQLPSHIKVHSSFLVPLLVAVKSPDKPISPELRQTLIAMRNDLPKNYRNELDELRMFMRLGGLHNDPFRAAN